MTCKSIDGLAHLMFISNEGINRLATVEGTQNPAAGIKSRFNVHHRYRDMDPWKVAVVSYIRTGNQNLCLCFPPLSRLDAGC